MSLNVTQFRNGTIGGPALRSRGRNCVALTNTCLLPLGCPERPISQLPSGSDIAM